MKCYNHSLSDAGAVCVYCGKGLCPSCSISEAGQIVCSESCARELLGEEYSPLALGRHRAFVKVVVFFLWSCAFLFAALFVSFSCVIASIAASRGLSKDGEELTTGIQVASAGISAAFLIGGFLVLRLARRSSSGLDVHAVSAATTKASALCKHCSKLCECCFSVSGRGHIACSLACADALLRKEQARVSDLRAYKAAFNLALLAFSIELLFLPPTILHKSWWWPSLVVPPLVLALGMAGFWIWSNRSPSS